MDYLVIVLINVVVLILIKFALDIKIKDIRKLKEIGYDKDLNEITNKLPENIEVCKTILKMLDNETVKIEESNNKTSLYLVLSNSIIIANIKDTFTRIQTIAHECIHSIQNRKILLFNFVFSNIYIIYFIIISILSIFKLNHFPMINLFILTILSFIQYIVRSYLEMDAMIKAKSLAEKYIKEQGILTNEEQIIVLENYDKINDIGIKLANYNLIIKCITKVIIYATICFLVYNIF